MQQMRSRNIAYQPYLDVELTDSVHRALAIDPEPDQVSRRDGAGSQSLRLDGEVDDDDEVIDEEVDD